MDSGQPPLSPTVAQAVHGLLRPSFPLAKLRDGGFLRALCSQPAGRSQSLHFIHWTDLLYALPSVPFRRGGLDEVISHKRAGSVCRLGRIPVRDLQAPPQAQPCTRQASLHVPLQTSETCGQEIALWDVSDSQTETQQHPRPELHRDFAGLGVQKRAEAASALVCPPASDTGACVLPSATVSWEASKQTLLGSSLGLLGLPASEGRLPP